MGTVVHIQRKSGDTMNPVIESLRPYKYKTEVPFRFLLLSVMISSLLVLVNPLWDFCMASFHPTSLPILTFSIAIVERGLRLPFTTTTVTTKAILFIPHPINHRIVLPPLFPTTTAITTIPASVVPIAS